MPEIILEIFLLLTDEDSEEVSTIADFGAKQKCVMRESGRNRARTNQKKIQTRPRASNFRIYKRNNVMQRERTNYKRNSVKRLFPRLAMG